MSTLSPYWNTCWAEGLVEELYRQGVQRCYLSSGSRSAPLALALARHPGMTSLCHYDERGAAFAAMGWGRATGQPALWLTTSGTAVANGLPAVVEASQSQTPMILLTADRPPELRDVGANQTIVQPGIFGAYVRWSIDLPCPAADPGVELVLSAAAQAVQRAGGRPAGPVHINFMLREPLTGPAVRPDGCTESAAVARWRASGAPYVRELDSVVQPSAATMAEIEALVGGAKRGLLAVGALPRSADVAAVRRLALRLRWPVLADVTSGLRLNGRGLPTLCPHYEAMLLSDRFRAAAVPDVILQFGGPLVSKRLDQYLRSAEGACRILVQAHGLRRGGSADDPYRWIWADVGAFCRAPFWRRLPPMGASRWQARWCGAAAARVVQVIEARLTGDMAASEPAVARVVSRWLPAGQALLLGNSMPVRDMNAFGVADGACRRVSANRGASGIDGQIATAVGLAEGWGCPITALLGDLSFLHDLNSLGLVRRSLFPVILVVINNDGGGIFSFLPVANEADVFESHFATPHGLTFAAAAAQFELDHVGVGAGDDFERAYRRCLRSGRSCVLEVRVDRQENVAARQDLKAALLAAVDGTD